MTTERDQFEEFYSRKEGKDALRREPNGWYAIGFTEDAWEVWQASRVFLAAAVPCAAVPDAATRSTYPADVSKNGGEIDAWHQAALQACFLTEACYVEADPETTIENLITWHAEAASQEQKHLGDPDEKTGIYAPPSSVAAVRPIQTKVDAGKLIVNSAIEPPGECRMVYIDMRSKRGEVAGWSEEHDTTPTLSLMATEESLHIDEAGKDITEIRFPELKGWRIEMAELGRYTVRVVFRKTAP